MVKKTIPDQEKELDDKIWTEQIQQARQKYICSEKT